MMCSLQHHPHSHPHSHTHSHTHAHTDHQHQPHSDLLMTILLRMDDKMNRQLTCAVSRRDSASALARDLVQLGFIHEADRDKICRLMEESLRTGFGAPPSPPAGPPAPPAGPLAPPATHHVASASAS